MWFSIFAPRVGNEVPCLGVSTSGHSAVRFVLALERLTHSDIFAKHTIVTHHAITTAKTTVPS